MERKYKDSGIEWIGKIPESWDVDIAKRVFKQRRDKGNEECQLLAATQKYGMYPQLLLEGVVKVAADTDLSLFKTVHKNDYVISLRSFQGGFEMSDYEGVCSPAYQVFYATRQISNQYYKYLFKSDAFIQEINSLTVGIREGKNILYDDFALLPIPIPAASDQQRIADYLDEKCGEIDSLIALQVQMIEKLKAYKQSVITEAVTKGLDPNAKLVPSGIDWIGDIPEQWKTCKLKSYIKLIESGVSVNAGNIPAKESEIGVLKTSCVSKFIFKVEENKTVNDNERERVACPVRNNTIIVSRMNTPELVGACGYVEKDYTNIFLPDRLWQVHFKHGISVKFVWYVLSCSYIRNYYSSLSVGSSSSMQNISQDQFANAKIIIPSLSVQQTITSYLDEKCSEIDNLIAVKQQKIEKLKDYKKSVIYEAVTGKIDLRDS